MTTKLYILVEINRQPNRDQIYNDPIAAFNFTQNHVLPHWLHLFFSEHKFQEFVGNETYEIYNKLRVKDPAVAFIKKFDLISDCWDAMMKAITDVW